jgi:hypothetical protein
MKLRISYGRHYFIRATSTLGSTSFSVDNVLSTLRNSVNNRMTYGRAEFDPSSLPHRFGDDVTVNENRSQTSSTKLIDFMNDDGNDKKDKEDKEEEEEEEKNGSTGRGYDGDNKLNRSNSGKTDCDGNNDIMDVNTSSRMRRERGRGRGVNDLLGLSDHDDDNEDEENDEDDWGLLENPVMQDAYKDEDETGDEEGDEGDLSSGTATALSKRKSGMTHSFNNSMYSVTSLSPSPSSFPSASHDINATADAALLVFGDTVLGDMGYTVKSRHVLYNPTVYSKEESKEDREADREEVKEGELEDVKEGSRARVRAGAGASVSVEKEEVKEKEEEAVWEVTVIASASYVVHVSLTAELKIIKASERSLSWVNGTLLGGVNREKSPTPGGLTGLHVAQDLLEFTPPDKEILRTHDVRTRLTSTKRLYPCDALYRAVCPHGMAPIEIDPATQLPRSSLHLPEGYRVIFARKLHDRTYYQYSDNECSDDEYQLHTLIRVSRSTHYEGENGNLNNQRDISDLNLQVNIDPLIAFHQYPNKHSTPTALCKVNRFLTRAISHSVLLSDRIEATHNTV